MTHTTTHTENLHLFIVKYLGATNTKPSRYKLISERFKQSEIFSYKAEQNFNSSIEYAIDTLKSKGFNVIGKCEGQGCDYIITDTFKPLNN